MAFSVLRRLIGVLTAASIGAGALAAPTPLPPRPAAVDADAYLLLSLQMGRLPLEDTVQGYETPTGVCLNLAELSEALDFPIRVNASAMTATGWFIKETQTFHLSPDAVSIGGKSQPVAHGDLRQTPEGPCVDAGAFARWTGVTLTPHLQAAQLVITSAEKLPLERALERKSRRAKFRTPAPASLDGLPRASLPYAMWRTPSLDFNASLETIDDRARNRQQTLRQYELYAAGEAFHFSIDSRLTSDERGVPATLRMRAYRADPDGGLLGPLKATMVALGDVSGRLSRLVNQSSAGRGAFVTNEPFDRPQNFDRTEFRGELPQGWDVELYRNGQLLAFADERTDGRYAFTNVPLLFGLNRFEIVTYGPQGQVRREQRVINVGGEAVQPGKTSYWAGIMQDGTDLVRLQNIPAPRGQTGLRASAIVDHGLDQRTSLSLQLHSLELEDQRLTYVEGAVRRSIGPALAEIALASDLENGLAGQLTVLGEFGNSYATLESTWARGFGSDQIERGLKSRHSLSIDHFFTAGAATVPVKVATSYTDWRNRADEIEVAARVSANLRGLSLTQELRWQTFKSHAGPDPPDRMDAALLANIRAGAVRLRGEARYRLSPSSTFESATLVADWQSGARGSWRAEIGYENMLDRGRAAIGYAHRFDRFILGGRVEGATDGAWAAGLNLAFSLGPDSEGRWGRMTSHRQAGQAMAAARVFTDSNADGQWQPGEAIHDNVGVSAGSASFGSETGPDGMAMIDNLRPFQPQLLSIDTSTLPDPYLQPASPGLLVLPRPGLSVPVDLPLRPTGDVESLLTNAAGQPQPGVMLELVDGASKVIMAHQSDFDGFVLFESVPYGRYSLRLRPDVARILGVAPLLHADVSINAQTPSVRLGTLRLGDMPSFTVALAQIDVQPESMSTSAAP